MSSKALWLVILVGSPCLVVFILVCACCLRRNRARKLGVLPERHYSFHLPGGVLLPPQSLGPIIPDRNGSQDALIESNNVSNSQTSNLSLNNSSTNLNV